MSLSSARRSSPGGVATRMLRWGMRLPTMRAHWCAATASTRCSGYAICRGSGLPLLFLLSPANTHDAPCARPLLETALRLYGLRPRVVRLDAGYWGLQLIAWIHTTLGAVAVIPRHPLEPQAPEASELFTSDLDARRPGETDQHRAVLWPRLFALQPLPLAAPAASGLDGVRDARRADLRRHPRGRAGCQPGGPAGPHSLPDARTRPYLGRPANMSWETPSHLSHSSAQVNSMAETAATERSAHPDACPFPHLWEGTGVARRAC